MKCPHERKIAWETDAYRVACLDCGEILIQGTAPELPEEVQTIVVPRVYMKRKFRLSENGRMVLKLRREMLTHQDIAKEMRLSVSVVKMIETKALIAVKEGAA